MASKPNERGEVLTRGALAAQTGCNVETIRYYEQIGMLPPPPPAKVDTASTGKASSNV
jgi:MerR family mercuric resistance operon transcriptional regulator